MKDQSIKNKEKEEVLNEYILAFGGSLPSIPMMQCSGYYDNKYIAMLKSAIKRGTPVDSDDVEEFFPIDDDATY